MTDSHIVKLDADQRPLLQYKGFATQNRNGRWEMFCNVGVRMAQEICTRLGFKRFRYVTLDELPTRKSRSAFSDRSNRHILKHVRGEFELDALRGKIESRKYVQKKRYPEPKERHRDFEEIVKTGRSQCATLYVECLPQANNHKDDLTGAPENVYVFNLNTTVAADSTGWKVMVRFPWIARIYVNGKVQGVGVLLSHHWVLTVSRIQAEVK